MPGALMQLVHTGREDAHLTAKPEITFFKIVYRRYTNFSMESIDQTIQGSAQLGGHFSVTIENVGDLAYRSYLQIPLKYKLNTNTPEVRVSDIIDYVEVRVGDQYIDRHYGHWLDIWNELTQEPGKKKAWDLMTGVTSTNTNIHVDTNQDLKIMYVPLAFWFCRSPGLAVPLISLPYHDVTLHFHLKSSSVVELYKGGDSEQYNQIKVYVDQIFLDNEEKQRFAANRHEYLIEQVQYHQTDLKTSTEIIASHPVKSIVWRCEDSNGDPTFNPENNETTLTFNGSERFYRRSDKYFSLVQNYQSFPNIPDQSKAIQTYNFGFKPYEHQPSGTCNMSRLKTVRMRATNPPSEHKLNYYTLNYNILGIMSGQGALLYKA